MATPLVIRLFGELDLRLGETSLPRLESARAESLLAYLLLHREAAQPRQRIAFLLWPDSTEAQAQTNLRHVLHNLRRALPEADRYLEVGQRTLRWRADAPFRLDVAAFEEALARADAADAADVPSALRDAVAAYAGDLLEGCYDDWLLEERERLSQRHLEALERLAELLEELGEHAQAIPYAERLLRQDPLREQTYRLLMRLYDARGDRARAVRVYHACTATLERELGVEPSPATREVYEALLPAESGPAAAGPKSGRLTGPALVGRAAERTQLSALWRASEHGRAQLVLVSGEPGIGKTRLVEELRSWCAHRGVLTAEARSYLAEGALAYGPVVAWLRSEALAARRGRVDRRHLSELGRLLPELAHEHGLDPPEPLPESEQRQRLFDALVRAIRAPDAPLLLVADDIHWADPETLQFLHYLLRSEPDAPLLVAATCTAGGARPEPPVERPAGGSAVARTPHRARAAAALAAGDGRPRRAAIRTAPRRAGRGSPLRRDRGQPALRRRDDASRLDGRAARPGADHAEGAGGDRVPARATLRRRPRSRRRRSDDRTGVRLRPARSGRRQRRGSARARTRRAVATPDHPRAGQRRRTTSATTRSARSSTSRSLPRAAVSSTCAWHRRSSVCTPPTRGQ